MFRILYPIRLWRLTLGVLTGLVDRYSILREQRVSIIYGHGALKMAPSPTESQSAMYYCHFFKILPMFSTAPRFCRSHQTRGNIQWPINLVTYASLECGRKMEHSENVQTPGGQDQSSRLNAGLQCARQQFYYCLIMATWGGLEINIETVIFC